MESFEFFRHVSSVVRDQSKGYLIAEDMSPVSKITTSPEEGGLGYSFKWNMGWMFDLLRYMGTSAEGRHGDHEDLVHSLDYAFNENFVLEFSHDEVSPGKGSLFSRMSGNELDRFGALKTLYTFQFTHPGKKLLFMGQDQGVVDDWDYNQGLDWSLMEHPGHADVLDTVRALLELYKNRPELSSDSMDPATFEWVSRNDSSRSTVAFLRKNPWNMDGALLVVCNFSPTAIGDYTVGCPRPGLYERLFTTYDQLPDQGGSQVAPLTAQERECDGRPYTLSYGLRPYESVIFAVTAA